MTSVGPGFQRLTQNHPVGDDQLCRRRGSGGAPVGHVVGDGKVRFMAHAADHRNPAAKDGPRHHFFIEGPEVFQGTAAPGNDDDIAAAIAVQPVQGGGDGWRCVQALNLGGGEEQGGQRVAAADDVLDVLPGRPGGRGDHADYLGELGQGTFAGLLEQAFLGQAGFQPFQLQGQLALSFGQHPVNHKIGGTPGFVEADPPVGPHRLAVCQHSGPALPSEEDTVQRGDAVLEGKVGMAGGGGAQVGNLTDNPQVGQEGIALQQFPKMNGHLADGEDILAGKSQGVS